MSMEAERFAPYQSRARRPTEDSTRGGGLGLGQGSGLRIARPVRLWVVGGGREGGGERGAERDRGGRRGNGEGGWGVRVKEGEGERVAIVLVSCPRKVVLLELQSSWRFR